MKILSFSCLLIFIAISSPSSFAQFTSASLFPEMKAHLHPYALMVHKENVKAMKEAILKVMEGDPQQLPAKVKGREYVANNWSRSLAFDNLYQKVNEIISAC